MWCGACYLKAPSDNFYINKPVDEDGIPMYERVEDEWRYTQGIDGAHVIVTFQCDLCIFRTLFNRDPIQLEGDRHSLSIIRRMNLDAIWSREPSTITNNLRNLTKMIRFCETHGLEPQLPQLGPWELKDTLGYCLAFSMLEHSKSSGKHARSHTQFATIRQQRAAYSNLFQASCNMNHSYNSITQSNQGRFHLAQCPSNSVWFTRWSRGCETRMGYIIKQDKALSIDILKALISHWIIDIENSNIGSWQRLKTCMALTYITISFVASLRGAEGLKLDLTRLKFHFINNDRKNMLKGSTKIPPHVIMPLRGRFKGEQGERCHLLPLAIESKSGIKIKATLELLIQAREDMPHLNSSWAFVDQNNQKLPFGIMNEWFHQGLETIKENDFQDNLGLRSVDIREEYSINRSCRRGSSTHAQNQNISESIIRMQNRWSMVENAKGRRPTFNMVETYSDIEHLIPAVIQYSGQL